MKRAEAAKSLTWWQRPGLGVAYTVESRPGWAWMQIVGQWYKPRKQLFNEATPLRYEGATAPGVSGLPSGYKTIASKLGDDVLVHIIKVEGSEDLSEIAICEAEWTGIKEIHLEPGHQSLQMEKRGELLLLHLVASQVDPVDTIVRLKF